MERVKATDRSHAFVKDGELFETIFSNEASSSPLKSHPANTNKNTEVKRNPDTVTIYREKAKCFALVEMHTI